MSFEDEAAGVAVQAAQRLAWDGTTQAGRRLTSLLLGLAKRIMAGGWHAVKAAGVEAWEGRQLSKALAGADVVPSYAQREDGTAEAWFDAAKYFSKVPAKDAAVLAQLAWEGAVDGRRAAAADTWGRAHELISSAKRSAGKSPEFVWGLDDPTGQGAPKWARARYATTHPVAAGRASGSAREGSIPDEPAPAAGDGRAQASAAGAAGAREDPTPWRDAAFWGREVTEDQRASLAARVEDGGLDAALADRAHTLGAAHAALNTVPGAYRFVRGLDDPMDPRAPEEERAAWLEGHPDDAWREPWDDMAHAPFAQEEAAAEPTASEAVVPQVGDDVTVRTPQGGNARGRARGLGRAGSHSREDARERAEESRERDTMVVAVDYDSPARARATGEEAARTLGVTFAVSEQPDGSATLVIDWPADKAGALASAAWRAEGAKSSRDLKRVCDAARAQAQAQASGLAAPAQQQRGPSMRRGMGDGA